LHVLAQHKYNGCFVKCDFILGGSEDSKNTKSTRALETTRNVEGDDVDGLDQRGRLGDDDGEETTKVPPGFLSPSVREYLELGRSIPGR